MKSVLILAFGVAIAAQTLHHPPETDSRKIQTFHHCSFGGGSENTPHLFDTSEIYSCDESRIEIAGQWGQSIEYGYIYTSQLGRPGQDKPRRATEADYAKYKWCDTDLNHKLRCGDKPVVCWDGRLATWDKKWQGYSCGGGQ